MENIKQDTNVDSQDFNPDWWIPIFEENIGKREPSKRNGIDKIEKDDREKVFIDFF